MFGAKQPDVTTLVWSHLIRIEIKAGTTVKPWFLNSAERDKHERDEDQRSNQG